MLAFPHHTAVDPLALIYGPHELVVDVSGLTVAELQAAYQDVLSLGFGLEAYLNGNRINEENIVPLPGDRLEFMKPHGCKGSSVLCDIKEFAEMFDVNDDEHQQLLQSGISVVPIGSYSGIVIKEARLALERIRQQATTSAQPVRVELEQGVVCYRGTAYEMDPVYLAIVKALVDANGEVRSRAAIQASSTLLVDESRIDRCIKTLKQRHPTIGKLIKPVPSKGYRLTP